MRDVLHPVIYERGAIRRCPVCGVKHFDASYYPQSCKFCGALLLFDEEKEKELQELAKGWKESIQKLMKGAGMDAAHKKTD